MAMPNISRNLRNQDSSMIAKIYLKEALKTIEAGFYNRGKGQ